MVQSKLLTKYRGLLHYFGDKKDLSNLAKLGIRLDNIITGEQVHGNKVVILKNDKSRFIKEIDALITRKPLMLGIRTADCLPIFFYDPRNQIVAAIHAGWKGLSAGIIKNAVWSMRKLSSNPQNIKVAVGPHIQVCCYNVSKDRIAKFGKYKEVVYKQFLNLGKIALQQMLGGGLLRKNIDISSICTSCDRKFWSARRDREKADRMINVIGMISN